MQQPELEWNVAAVSKYEQAALDAITRGESMGRMAALALANAPKEVLQKYSRAYDALRR